MVANPCTTLLAKCHLAEFETPTNLTECSSLAICYDAGPPRPVDTQPVGAGPEPSILL